MQRTITFQGAPLNLVGRAVQVGQVAPDFRAVSSDMKEVHLSDFRGKTKVLSIFPSLDTPVCDMQVKEFNKHAAGFSRDVAIIGISHDLPFAQKRFCDDNAIHDHVVVSDYRHASFGINYGLWIRDLNLLARAVVIIDKNEIIRHFHLVGELTHAPDYAEVLQALREVHSGPPWIVEGAFPARCKPCEGGVPPLSAEKARKLASGLWGWEIDANVLLKKEYSFKGYSDAQVFVRCICCIAEEQNHHPVVTFGYSKVKVSLTTHAAEGLTENDFVMARIIDSLYA